ncbi:MAG: sugar nucleotide-binding protein [Akkermansiaceae bacterium]
MRVAVTGTTGRVGAALARHLSDKHEVITLPRQDFDLLDPSALAGALERLECDVLINPAGITGLEACEDDLFHACHSGEATSWHGMATAVVEEMAARGVIRTTPEITALKLDEVEAFRATRPKFTAMDNGRLAKLMGAPPRPWREAVADYVRDRCALL